jgi:hypothetical protein
VTELLDAFESLISQPEISPHTFCHQLQSLYHLSTALPLLSIYSTAYFQHSLCHLSTALPLQHSLYHHFYSTAYTAQPLPYVYSTAYTAQPLPSFPQPLQPPISARLTSVSAHTSMRETSPVLPSTCICNVHTPNQAREASHFSTTQYSTAQHSTAQHNGTVSMHECAAHL